MDGVDGNEADVVAVSRIFRPRIAEADDEQHPTRLPAGEASAQRLLLPTTLGVAALGAGSRSTGRRRVLASPAAGAAPSAGTAPGASAPSSTPASSAAAAAALAAAAASAAAFISSLTPAGAAMVATVKSRSRIVGRMPSGSVIAGDVQRVGDVEAGEIGDDLLRNVVDRRDHRDAVADDVEHAAAADAGRLALVDELHRHLDGDGRAGRRRAGSRRASASRSSGRSGSRAAARAPSRRRRRSWRRSCRSRRRGS